MAPGERHVVAGHALALAAEGEACVLLHRPAGAPADAPEDRHRLALAPPCHFLVWQTQPPARAGSPSDGVSLGTVGAPMAWRYKSAKDLIALAVIGDALTDQQKSEAILARRLAAGLRCAPSLQGILLTATQARLTKKRDHTQVHCVEAGTDEKTFWLLAHE
ncbi:MAG TPA: hypothetical protein VGG33_03355 [Polyangia bacterium]